MPQTTVLSLFLDIDEDYDRAVFERVPNVKEDNAEIQQRNLLADGDDQGYLLQILKKNVCGPSFIELIQRDDHLSFGAANFGALFRSIARAQEARRRRRPIRARARPSALAG